MPADLAALKRDIEKLSPPDRLRLAANLLQAGRAALAHTIAERVVIELGAALALSIPEPRPRQVRGA